MNVPVIATVTTRVMTVLSVSPTGEDHRELRAIVRHARWKLLQADNCAAAATLFREYEIPVVLCECTPPMSTWIDLLNHIQPMRNPPALIVTYGSADRYLWKEALNLGAWDVLARPFERSAVIRTVKLAWDYWHHQIDAAATFALSAT